MTFTEGGILHIEWVQRIYKVTVEWFE